MKVTVGIPTFNSEANIITVLESLLSQKTEGLRFRILVMDDASTDTTVSKCREWLKKNRGVQVIANKKRRGFAGEVKDLMKRSDGEVLVIINDDVLINDKRLLQKIVGAFTKNDRVGMVSTHTLPLRGGNFVQRACAVAFDAFEEIRYGIRKGNNLFTCDGKAIALSKEFVSSLRLPSDNAKLGNVDSYLYLCCRRNGFEYKHVRNARVYFKFPDNWKDYLLSCERNNANKFLFQNEFGDSVEREYKIPGKLYWSATLKQLVMNPVESVVIFLMNKIGMSRAKSLGRNFEPMWESVRSTKRNLVGV